MVSYGCKSKVSLFNEIFFGIHDFVKKGTQMLRQMAPFVVVMNIVEFLKKHNIKSLILFYHLAIVHILQK